MVKRFFSQAWLYHKARTAAFDWREFLFFDTGYPIITLVFYCLLAAYSFQTADLTHWVIGNSFLMCVNTCILGLEVYSAQNDIPGGFEVSSPLHAICFLLFCLTVLFRLFLQWVLWF